MISFPKGRTTIFVCFSLRPSIRLSIQLICFVCLVIQMSVCLSISLRACLPAWMFIYYFTPNTGLVCGETRSGSPTPWSGVTRERSGLPPRVHNELYRITESGAESIRLYSREGSGTIAGGRAWSVSFVNLRIFKAGWVSPWMIQEVDSWLSIQKIVASDCCSFNQPFVTGLHPDLGCFPSLSEA